MLNCEQMQQAQITLLFHWSNKSMSTYNFLPLPVSHFVKQNLVILNDLRSVLSGIALSAPRNGLETIASFRIHDKKGGEDKACRARRRTQAG